MHIHFIQNQFFSEVFPPFSYLLLFIGSVKLQGNKNNLGQKLSSLLSSDADSRKVEELDNPHEILKMLIDLVSITS